MHINIYTPWRTWSSSFSLFARASLSCCKALEHISSVVNHFLRQSSWFEAKTSNSKKIYHNLQYIPDLYKNKQKKNKVSPLRGSFIQKLKPRQISSNWANKEIFLPAIWLFINTKTTNNTHSVKAQALITKYWAHALL